MTARPKPAIYVHTWTKHSATRSMFAGSAFSLHSTDRPDRQSKTCFPINCPCTSRRWFQSPPHLTFTWAFPPSPNTVCLLARLPCRTLCARTDAGREFGVCHGGALLQAKLGYGASFAYISSYFRKLAARICQCESDGHERRRRGKSTKCSTNVEKLRKSAETGRKSILRAVGRGSPRDAVVITLSSWLHDHRKRRCRVVAVSALGAFGRRPSEWQKCHIEGFRICRHGRFQIGTIPRHTSRGSPARMHTRGSSAGVRRHAWFLCKRWSNAEHAARALESSWTQLSGNLGGSRRTLRVQVLGGV